MDSELIRQHLNAIIQPDIKCFVNKNKETGVSKVGIEYTILNMRSGLTGGVEEGVLDIGNTLYQSNLKNAFIQIFNENGTLICNQKFNILIHKQPHHRTQENPDFLINIVPATIGTGFSYAIKSLKGMIFPVTGQVTKNSYKETIPDTPKSVLIKICFELVKHHHLIKSYQIHHLIHINIHHIDYDDKLWKITNNEFEVSKR